MGYRTLLMGLGLLIFGGLLLAPIAFIAFLTRSSR